MGCKATAKLTCGSMWGGMSWRTALPGLTYFGVMPEAKSSKEMGEKWSVQVHCRRAA